MMRFIYIPVWHFSQQEKDTFYKLLCIIFPKETSSILLASENNNLFIVFTQETKTMASVVVTLKNANETQYIILEIDTTNNINGYYQRDLIGGDYIELYKIWKSGLPQTIEDVMRKEIGLD